MANTQIKTFIYDTKRWHLSISSWKLEWIVKHWWEYKNRRWEFIEFRKQKQWKNLLTNVQEKSDAVNVEHHNQYQESCALG